LTGSSTENLETTDLVTLTTPVMGLLIMVRRRGVADTLDTNSAWAIEGC
jgi:hypothetical protein